MSYTWVLNIFQVDFCIWYKIGIQFVHLHVDIIFFQCYLLKKLSFCVFLELLLAALLPEQWEAEDNDGGLSGPVIENANWSPDLGVGTKDQLNHMAAAASLWSFSQDRGLWHTNSSFIQW